MRVLFIGLVIAVVAMVAAIAFAVRPHGNEVRLYHAAVADAARSTQGRSSIDGTAGVSPSVHTVR